MYSLFVRLVHARRILFDRDEPLEWLDGWGEGVLAFRRGNAVCAANFSESVCAIPGGFAVVESSDLGTGADVLPADSAVWLRLEGDSAR